MMFKFYRKLSWYWALKALFKRGPMAFIRQRLRAKAYKHFARLLKRVLKP